MSRLKIASKWEAIDPSRIAPTRLRHTAAKLFGREEALAGLEAAWNDEHTHVVVIQAWGGIGKTSLVAEWMARQAAGGWRGARWVFDWSFYSQGMLGAGRAEGAVSADLFIATALAFFGDPDPQAGSAWDRGARLAGLVARERGLLVLDGVEPLQHPPGPLAGQISDPALLAALKGLAQRNAGLCLVTTRAPLVDLATFRDRTVLVWQLDSLTEEAGAELLHALGVTRAGEAEIEPHDRELCAAAREVHGHALTLQLMGRYLAAAKRGDVRKRDVFDFTAAERRFRTNAQDQARAYGHAFTVIAEYESWLPLNREDGDRELAILRLLGLFDRPADAGCLAALRAEPPIVGLTEPLVGIDDDEWEIALSQLEYIQILTRSDTSALDAHPLVREYFAWRLRETNVTAWRTAQGRLFDHLCRTTKAHRPDTLAELQPLYHAVSHGCLAGRAQEAWGKVYFDRIKRGDEHYSTQKLGAFGSDLVAIASFFERPWSRVSPALTEAAQAWLLNAAAVALRALGRLTEAVEPIRTVTVMTARLKDWKNAAIDAGNLSELQLTLGAVSDAVLSGEQSVAYADRSGNEFVRLYSRTTLADALHQAAGCRPSHRERGRFRGAKGENPDPVSLFRDAESFQAAMNPANPLLHSPAGFRYSDLLLAGVERAAWQATLALRSEIPDDKPENLDPSNQLPTSGVPFHPEHSQVCDAVSRRATKTLAIASRNNWLLDIALDHLTLSRVALYRAILVERAVLRSPTPASRKGFDTAVNALRGANSMDHMPRGLLTRAWYLSLIGEASGSRADLDEAWEVAERGSMKLFQADIRLTRARLFGTMKDEGGRMKDEPVYPWQSPQHDLAEARGLITNCGYGRRLPELADAEAALGPGDASV